MKRTIYLCLTLFLFVTPVSVNAQNTFFVDTWSDEEDLVVGDGNCSTISGECSLRAAIQEANATPNGASPDEIFFTNIPILVWFALIQVIDDDLPSITESVVIDATTAAGDVILEGGSVVSTSNTISGLKLVGGSDGSTIRGLSIGNFEFSGIYITSSSNRIENNYIGTLSDGTDYGNGYLRNIPGGQCR